MEDLAAEGNIDAQLVRRRRAAAEAWKLTDEVVLVGAGQPIAVPGRGDLTYPFRAHSEYYYLTDRNQPGGVLAFDPREGWLDFQSPVSDSDRLWSGTPGLEPGALMTDALADWLHSRSSRTFAQLGVPSPGTSFDGELTEELRLALNRVRRPKDGVELERMRLAARATGAAFAAAETCLREGVSERETQVELEAAAFRAGADAMAYDTIVGGGPNSAVLHFPPSRRRFGPQELVLIDAGAEYLGYASDITRTYVVGGRFSPEQRELYTLVAAAESAAIELCRPGTEWREVHRRAALVIAEGLGSFGLLRGEPEALVESGAVWLFFPHGIGHLVGLGVRDAGGALAERRDHPPPFPNLRIDLPLDPGMVVTIEPGIYFVPALLEDADRRRRHGDQVDWDRAEAMLGFGGIRIEDNALITAEGNELLTRHVPIRPPD